jgi:hypothetical protein
MDFLVKQGAGNYSTAMRIDSSGNVLVGTTSTDTSTTSGFTVQPDGQCFASADGQQVVTLSRLTSDGEILRFRRGGTTVGSIGSTSGVISHIILDPRSSLKGAGILGASIDANTGIIQPCDRAGAVADNAINLGTSSNRWKDLYLGGNVILSSGQGIDFSATADATGMTSELLDDYEEGTWTPVVRGSGTAGTYELSSSYAYYTKVGRLVTIHLSIGLDDPITGGGSGYTQITGLPYAKASGFHTTAVVNSIGFDYTGDYLITRFTTAGDTSTKLGIFGNVDNGSLSLTPISGLSAGDSFTITVSYLT